MPALLILSTALAAGAAQADVLDLTGLVGQANLYSLSNISVGNNSIAGGIVANGNVSGSSYKIGTGAYGNYSVIASGNFSYSNGQLAGGYIGARTGIRFGARVIRPLVVLVSVALALRLLFFR